MTRAQFPAFKKISFPRLNFSSAKDLLNIKKVK